MQTDKTTFEELDERARVDLFLDGVELSEESAADLEAHLLQSPGDLFARVKLLAYYRRHNNESSKFRDRHFKHSLFIVDNYPDHTSLFRTLLFFSDATQEENDAITDHWLAQTRQHPQNPIVLGNAGCNLSWFDFELGQKLLHEAHSQQDENLDWLCFASIFCYGQILSKDATTETKEACAREILKYAQRLAEEKEAPSWRKQDVLRMIADCLTVLRGTELDTTFLKQLEVPPQPPNQYALNAERALTALEWGNIAECIEYLFKEEPGFTRGWDVNTTQLLQELCARQEADAVIRFLESLDDTIPLIRRRRSTWISEIRNSEVPSFGLDYQPAKGSTEKPEEPRKA